MTNQIPIPEFERLLNIALTRHSMTVYVDCTAGYSKEVRERYREEFREAVKDLRKALIPGY